MVSIWFLRVIEVRREGIGVAGAQARVAAGWRCKEAGQAGGKVTHGHRPSC